MNKKPAIALTIILLAVGGGGYWYFFMRGGDGEETPPSDTGEFTGTIAEALESGESMKCTWRDNGNAEYQSAPGNAATIFVRGDRYRGEITSDGESTDYLCVDECLYQWKDTEAQGSKTCWVPVEGEGMLPPKEMTAPVPELGYTYTCQPSPIPDSFFVPPVEIEF